ncbi:MAG: CxxxxCH/CxxCH domain-containing protein [Anaeromyxobacter sp.]
MRTLTPLAPLAAVALLATGCGGNGNDSASTSCTSCHATTALATGAHAAHLQGGAVAGPVACSECHVVPTDTAHAELPVSVAFATAAGDLAAHGGLVPSYDPGSKTCSSVYCHGGGLSAGSNTSPAWPGGAAQAACGTCHGMPPTANEHPQVTTAYCTGCHPGTMNDDGSLDVAGGEHVNGIVEAVSFSHDDSMAGGWLAGHQHAASTDGGVSCKACHGADFKGGTSGRSCYTCHPSGPPV